jgi:hypothetical protein
MGLHFSSQFSPLDEESPAPVLLSIIIAFDVDLLGTHHLIVQVGSTVPKQYRHDTIQRSTTAGALLQKDLTTLSDGLAYQH